MKKKNIIALMYDFDRTLSPKDMQEYAFIPALGMDAPSFWKECDRVTKKYSMDPILSYMYKMLELSEGRQIVTRDSLRAIGKEVKLFSGVATWFSRVNEYAKERGLIPEHYIISSGLKEIIEGTPIAGEFRMIYAASFCFNEKGVPFWPATAVNYTSKTQFLYRINKGVLDTADNKIVNEYMPEEHRRIPFRNMIYFGDGITDIPTMKLTKANGGHSVAVYQNDRSVADRMLLDGRVDYVIKADYSKGSEMERTVFEVIDQIAATSAALERHFTHLSKAKDEN
ncbi:MAG: haloacid dehalogenase-like hydrolase [Clostridia bacterium]|nr:haloacid dehalogenase-like hydrolase [Clostridia bacterium]